MKTTIFDVAEYILSRTGVITAMQLERLCYYAQAWSLVWDGRPLFDGEFLARSAGPVCPELYARHRGEFDVKPGGFHGDPAALDESGRDTVDAVLRYYGTLSVYELSTLVHREPPWRDAMDGHVITRGAMAGYYGSLAD